MNLFPVKKEIVTPVYPLTQQMHLSALFKVHSCAVMEMAEYEMIYITAPLLLEKAI